jgi:MoaA/NifB/PqqE/SkfB family radical SAM enzyme
MMDDISFPEIVTFRINSRCNNNCRFCYGPKNIRSMRLPKIKRMIDSFKAGGVKAIVITGGEPLLYKYIDQILNYIHRNGLKIFLDTNGKYFFLHKHVINRCVDTIGLPLDSASRAGSYRQKINFDVTIKVLEYYQDAKLNKRPEIRVGTVATKENYNNIELLGEYLSEFDISAWKIYQFIPIGLVASQNKHALNLSEKKFFQTTHQICKKFRERINIIISPRKKRANAYFLINPDGTVITPHDNGRSCREIKIGSIFEKDITKKWNKYILPKSFIENAEKTFSHKWQAYPMDKIYNKIWELASPFNERGQSYTAPHIRWLLRESLGLIKEERVDDTILMPFLILHDVGYSKVLGNSFEKETRIGHMEYGSKITAEILHKVNYPSDKIKKISRYVALHDSWSLGKHKVYHQDKVLALFNDLDFISMLSEESQDSMMSLLKLDRHSFLAYMQRNEKLTNRPFSFDSTNKLFQDYLQPYYLT